MGQATLLAAIALVTAGATVPRFETVQVEAKADHALVKFTEEFAGADQLVTIQVSATAHARFPCGRAEQTQKVWSSGHYRADEHGSITSALRLSTDALRCGCQARHAPSSLKLSGLNIEDQTNGFEELVLSEVRLSTYTMSRKARKR
ncbi:MAG TPA: hypothetical protein VEX38_09710 [Fimbriimonadaceae bacterium]|nr:hypothetical protein [Fimbriimonadaceae bacterium]